MNAPIEASSPRSSSGRHGLLLTELLAGVPDVGAHPAADAGADPLVTGVELYDPATPPTAGHLVAVTAPGGEEPAIRRCAASGCSAVLLRAGRPVAEAGHLAGLAVDLGIALLWLAESRPWWPLLRDVESALSGAARPPTPDRPDDLFALADEMATAVGGPVILEDASFRVLAYSAFVGQMDRGRAEAILGRRIPDPWLVHLARTGSLRTLRSTTEVVDLADGPWQARRRLITAVRAGNRQLGVVWVAEGDTPLPDGVGAALRRAADDAVPQLIRHLDRADAEADRRSRHVQALLDGHPLAPDAAGELGFRPTGSFAVLAAAGPGPGRDPAEQDGPTGFDPAAMAGRLLDHVTLCCESFRRQAAVTMFGHGVLAVVTVPEGADDESTTRLGRELLRLAGAGPLAPLRIGVSSHGSGLASLGRLRDEAVGALHALDGEDRSRCASFHEVEAQVLVRSLVARLPPGSGLSGLDRLAAHDARHGGGLVTTLQRYLGACGSASAAAAALGVHVTTLRHRLNRIAEVSGLRLDDPAVRVACDLLLRHGSP